MEKKFTQGKLEVKPSEEYSNVVEISPTPTFEENEYNALLFEKAPELLEMLETSKNLLDELSKKYGFGTSVIGRIEQLIKSATEL